MFFYMVKKSKMIRKVCLILVVLLLALCAFPEYAGAEETCLSLYAAAAVLMDADSGRILYEKEGDSFLANASTLFTSSTARYLIMPLRTAVYFLRSSVRAIVL